MLDRLKSAMGFVPSAYTPPPGTALVPVISSEHQPVGKYAGALDRMPDSTRPTLMPVPPLRSFDQDARLAHMPASAHARHISQASGYISYGVELMTAYICGGDGLQPNITPDFEAIGWTADEGAAFAQQAEALFYQWCDEHESCDSRGRSKFGQLQSQAVRSYLLTGDILAVLDFGPKSHATFRTSVNLIDPLRVKTPLSPRYQSLTKHGIEFDPRGRAIAYYVTSLGQTGETERIAVHGVNGKRLVCHSYDGDAGTIRGVSPLGPAIGGLLQSMSAADAAVMSAHLQAMVLATITSDLPTEAVARALGGDGSDALGRMMQNRLEWHEALREKRSDVELGNNGRVVHLTSGERLEMHGAKNGFSDFETILKHGLREVSRALGLSYEALTSDKSGATYSSLKTANVETRAIVERRRKIILEPFCEWALEAVIEEMVANRAIELPQRGRAQRYTPLEYFRQIKRLALRTSWVGPSIPDPDELKSARAATLRVQSGLSSLSDEISAMGKDPDATMDRMALDKQALKKRELYLPQFETGIRRGGK